MLRSLLRGLILVFFLASAGISYAAPYKVSFSGVLNHILNEGRLVIGDEVSGEILYDTNLIDVDPALNTGLYPGASAKIQVGDLYFELSGYIFTNSAAVFSFQSQSPTLVPPQVSHFVEIGFYAPVLPGYGADLPMSDQRFSGPPEIAFNFQSIVNGITYYDVVASTAVNYALTPVPEAQSHIYVAFGLATILMVGLLRQRNLQWLMPKPMLSGSVDRLNSFGSARNR